MSELRYALRQLLKSPGLSVDGRAGTRARNRRQCGAVQRRESVFLRPLPYRRRIGWCA